MDVRTKKKTGIFLIILCWLAYTCAYMGRYSYSSNTMMVISHYGVTKASAGLISTMFFISYGVGQVVNGLCCKFYPKKQIIGTALFVTAAINLVLFFDVPFWSIKYLWLLNGIAQSVLWPTMMLTLGEYLSQKKLKVGVLVMATTVALGNVFSYGLSAIFVKFASFKFSFLSAAIIVSAAAIVWFITYGGAVKRATEERDLEAPQEKEKKSQKRGALTASFVVMLIFIAAFALVDNLVKDGLYTWVPNVLKETYGLEDSLSVLLTIVLALIGVFGSFAAVALQKKIKNFILLLGVFFSVASVCLLAVILLLQTNFWLLILIVFGVIVFWMHAINNVATSMAPLYLRKRINPGLMSGLMNGSCYIGSALSSYGLGAVADNFGWMSVFYLLLGCCVLPVVLSFVFLLFSRKMDKADEETE